MKRYADTLIKNNALQAKTYATTDRKDALKGADYVITMFQVGGVEAFQLDYEIPMKYGVDQCIGDSMGPGGVFRGLRTIPVMVDMLREMEELCPQAIVLNYVNPMATVCLGMGRASDIPFVGLCHGVQTTLDLIAGYVGVPRDQIDYVAAGINHMAWFLKIEKDGVDLYPTLKANFEKPEYYVNEKVRGEVMRHFGYFMTESTGHLSEYLPWFRKNTQGAGPVLRRAFLRRGDRRLLQVVQGASRRSTARWTSWTGKPESWSRAARSTARTSWRPWIPAGPSSSTAT